MTFDILGWQEGDGEIDEAVVERVVEDAHTYNGGKTGRGSQHYGTWRFHHPGLGYDGCLGIFLRSGMPPMMTPNKGGYHHPDERIVLLEPEKLSIVLRKLHATNRSGFRSGFRETNNLVPPNITLGTWFAICARCSHLAMKPKLMDEMSGFSDKPFGFYPGTVFLVRQVVLHNEPWNKGGPLP